MAAAGTCPYQHPSPFGPILALDHRGLAIGHKPGQHPREFPVHSPFTCPRLGDRKSTRLNSSHVRISYAVFCLKKTIHPQPYSLLHPPNTDTSKLTLRPHIPSTRPRTTQQ